MNEDGKRQKAAGPAVINAFIAVIDRQADPPVTVFPDELCEIRYAEHESFPTPMLLKLQFWKRLPVTALTNWMPSPLFAVPIFCTLKSGALGSPTTMKGVLLGPSHAPPKAKTSMPLRPLSTPATHAGIA